MGGEMKLRVRKNIYYFPDHGAAVLHATQGGWPTDRIIPYEIGWAIQLGASGNYVGPTSVADRRHAELMAQRDDYGTWKGTGK
jgi:hypothetical protein